MEAQAAVGSIVDPITGDHMSVMEALNRHLLDKTFAELLKRAERAVTGFKPKGSSQVLSLFQAMEKVGDLAWCIFLQIIFIFASYFLGAGYEEPWDSSS